ncbi:CRISPR-associated protein DxTHG [Thermococcus sp. 2319x1]|uniref:CRISPR-associated CARF protein Csx1 n=1 Tax=Thermococcus sp. 2319x1 TaxID=1674923 RepID=UPI00073AD906|nr:CRISPR-associated CARF protein Csx1 [Thermococcus sp. 2319x1]ALV63530.1 CRISPR-associated protein DxTHG [Thermococcus sp. 2319x1]
MKRVLVATWGNPFQWGEITYRVDCRELNLEDCENIEMRNVSTLPVLLKALKPDKTIILALDTLANLTHKNDVPAKELNSYDEVRKDVEERIRWFIENRVRSYISEDDGNLLNDVDVVVLPGLGEFDNVSVRGNLLDFYSMVLGELAERLPNGDAEVFLDLTHGINFMPVLTYRALTNLLGLLAYLHTARLHVLNSEPYPLGEGKWKERAIETLVLNIRSVESTELRPKPLYSVISDMPEWSAFISSVTNGFPLAFATFYPRMEKVREYVELKLRGFLNGIEVSIEPDKTGKNKVHVVRNISLDENFRTAAKLYYLLRVLKSEFGQREYPKRKKFTLEELNEITGKLFAKMPRIGIMVEDQIKELQDLVKDQHIYDKEGPRRKRGLLSILEGKVDKDLLPLKQGRAMSLGDVRAAMKLSPRSGEGRNLKPDLRNFIAHSGFEYNLVKVEYDSSEKKLYWFYQYSDDDCCTMINDHSDFGKECERVNSMLSNYRGSLKLVVCFLICALLLKEY